MNDEPTEEQRMAAARRRADWEIGDPSWADIIIGAYRDPVSSNDYVDRESAP